ncbi:MAG: DUF4445 domain-containing protein [Deltaproteobacteria bacterium]|nr:DUF4445 domain-containing protein [Deltaproteobacteria bacterium]MBW2105815.1 DUF4445 domain-containing protein [Deltaproteobacteria bacterium]
MKKFKVTFLPDGKDIEVEENTTLMQAAGKAGVYVNTICGGKGVCGKCRVQVINGKAKADKHAIALLTKEEIDDSYVLACQTRVQDNLEVVIPPESRLEAEQILLTDSFVSEAASVESAHFEPLVQKLYMELQEPSNEDNIADSDRIIRELKRKTKYNAYERSLGCLRELGSKLRNSGWKVTATIARQNNGWKILEIDTGDTNDNNYGLAIDVGTTTVVAQLLHLQSGKVIGGEGTHNLQSNYGEDVITRIAFACGKEQGLQELHKSIVKNINDLITSLTDKHGIDRKDITAIVAAGNTTMSHFLLGLMPCSIRLAPYVPTTHSFPQIKAREIDIDIYPEGILETLPDVASYVGGDIVSGVLACGIAEKPEIKVLIDIGTNGEIALGNNDWIVCCSASAGPAFEGGGVSCGMRAIRGAIQKIEIKNSMVQYRTIQRAKPRGICGSGLIDCIYELVKNGIIDQQGHFNMSTKNDRIIVKDDEPQFIVAFANETESGDDITLKESDITNLIRSKGAVFAAIKSLTDYVGIAFNAIDTFFVAGGFGNYLNISKSISIGLLPDIDPKKIQFVGNSSLIGARMALLSKTAFEHTADIANMMTNIELSTYLPYMDEYIASLFLPHTDKKLFPSVDYWQS